jgi:general secretion pathway protein D
VITLPWRDRLVVARVCGAASLYLVLIGCVTSSGTPTANLASADAMDSVRNADFSARFPQAGEGDPGRSRDTSSPLLFPGAETEPEPQRERDPDMRTASLQQTAFIKGDGVEMNFDGADVQTVAKSLLGDILQLNFVVDPRVQGNVTLSSAGPIPRKDVLPAFESVLRMSNAAIVRSGNLMKIVPIPEAAGGAISVGQGEQGFGVSLVPLRYTSAATVAKTAESFLSRPGAIRVVPSRNLLLIQGTTAERQAALDVVGTFDVEWLQNQSVGVYPLKSTSPETMIGELERVFETNEGGAGQGVVRFQPVSRMNAVMVVTKNPKLLAQTTQWIQRLDRSDTTGTTLRTFRLKSGNATQVAKILNDIFVGKRSGATTDGTVKQIAPGVDSTQSRLDSLDHGSSAGGSASQQTPGSGSDNHGENPIAAAFATFSDRKDGDADATGSSSAASGGNPQRGTFQNLRITADAANNAVVVYSNQEDYRIVERAVRDLDRPQLQVAIDATVAEVTLTDQLQYGVQFFLNGQNVSGGVLGAGAATAQSNASAITAASTIAQSALLQSVGPGVNLLLGSSGGPRAILNALQTVTDVKVLSSPSLVALDNQPALLQVGDEIPVTTSSAAILSNSATPIVNTIQMRDTGVILKVLPRVHSNGSIQLEIDQEISSVVNPDQQTLTPTISQRRVHSTVSIISGQTVLLAGLISENVQKTQSGVPGLRDIKILGDLLGNTNNTKTKSEIIIFIKTRLIRNSVDAGAVTEEFRDRLQLMRSGRTVVNGTGVQPVPGSGRALPN